MIQSMTGFGRAETAVNGGSLLVELRSVNHRYCDAVVRLPRFLNTLEAVCKKKIQSHFARGRFELSVSVQRPKGSQRRYTLDLDTAETYYRLLKRLKKSLHLSGEIDIALLSQFRELISVSEPEEPIGLLEKALHKTLGRAIFALEKMRKHEGKSLAVDVVKQLLSFSKRLVIVKSREKKTLASYHKRLRERVSDLSKGLKMDSVRLAQEVAIFAERSDISEERTRLDAHVKQFRSMIRQREAVGRPLDFLLQEMHREVNTLSSKSNDLQISMQVVAMKSELEKIREQVQNIE